MKRPNVKDAVWFAMRLRDIAPNAKPREALELLRAQRALRRWFERECNGEVQRDDATDKPFAYSTFDGRCIGPVRDLEKSAQKTAQKIADHVGVYIYVQTDPRGCSLYVAGEPLTDQNYSTKGIPCA